MYCAPVHAPTRKKRKTQRERDRQRERERDGKERKEVSTVEFQISRNRCCMGESTGDGLSGRHSRAIFTSSFGILATAARLQGTRKGLQLHRKGKGWGAERTVAMMSNLETRFSLLSACSIQESLCPYTLEPRILPISKPFRHGIGGKLTKLEPRQVLNTPCGLEPETGAKGSRTDKMIPRGL